MAHETIGLVLLAAGVADVFAAVFLARFGRIDPRTRRIAAVGVAAAAAGLFTVGGLFYAGALGAE